MSLSLSILGDGEALRHKGLEACTVPVFVPKTGTITGTVTGTVSAVGEFTVPVWAPETGTVLRGEYGGRLSKMAGNRKNISNIVKFFVYGQYMGAIDFYTVLTYNQFRIINNNCKQYFCIFHVIKIQKYS